MRKQFLRRQTISDSQIKSEEQRCSNREGKLVFLLHVNDFKVCIQTNNPSYFFEGDTLPEELLT